MKIYVIIIISTILILLLLYTQKENLSISQYPSKCTSSGEFYNCNVCDGVFFQDVNKKGQICNCGEFRNELVEKNYKLNVVPVKDPDLQILATLNLNDINENVLFNYLNNDALLIIANNGETVYKIIQKLLDHTVVGDEVGFPDFYDVEGPVLVMNKVKGKYFWMIDYPIKYTPSNIRNYVNTSRDWEVAKSMFYLGHRLIHPEAQVYFFLRNSFNISL